MTLPKRYQPEIEEPKLQRLWHEEGIYRFQADGQGEVYSIDTPPATVSGRLHLGHVYSYSHPDFMARYFRMRGKAVYYPMGFDDNGLPTDRLVEKTLGITAQSAGREVFIQKCIEVGEQAQEEYRQLWQRLGLSIDWNYTYRTIDGRSQRISQLSFIELYRKGVAYQKNAPVVWCPECHTAIAQADLDDLERESEFVTLQFQLEDGSPLPIATTRPELLAACVAVLVHPGDRRYGDRIGQKTRVPLYGQEVPILADPQADPEKGTGAVMCCTFGDQADVAWWYAYRLPLIEAIDRHGRMTGVSGELAGLRVSEARKRVKEILSDRGLLLERTPARQSIRVHERCDTPIEFIMTRQWFVEVLSQRERLLEAGEQIQWHPQQMRARYRAWVENLNWDWCISRQRAFGVPFPVWFCRACGQVKLADESQLPIDPQITAPLTPCKCGSREFEPETDVMDTWATSSMSPQIAGGFLENAELYQKVFPYSLRPQAHEIIRTWAFYTIVKSLCHYDRLPWSEVLISGWGIAGEGMGKISKSRGGGPMAPMEMIERYSADAVRYWAASTSPGKDSIISEEKIQMGMRLVTKLWNVARFAESFLSEEAPGTIPEMSPADRWILARLQSVIAQASHAMDRYEYAQAKTEVEQFFWQDLADNYMEMAKQRLYDPEAKLHAGAVFALRKVLYDLLRLLAPFLPYITDAIYRQLFTAAGGRSSIHSCPWPEFDPSLADHEVEKLGEKLVAIATTVRRFKSEQNISLGSALSRLQLALADPNERGMVEAAGSDLLSVTRAARLEIVEQYDPELELLSGPGEAIQVAVER